MKKLLLASTAIVGFAGAAAAEVSISGSAEIGIADDNVETLFFQSVDVRFAMTGETDSGLSFGATIDLEDALDSAVGGDDTQSDFGSFADYTVFVSGAFGKLTMGDTDGGFDWAMTEVGMGDAIADDHTTHSGYSGNSGLDGTYNGQVARYEYSFGSFGFAASVELDETGVDDPVLGLGVKYATDLGGTKLSFGLGYQETDIAGTSIDVIGVSAKAELAGGFSGVVNYSELSAGASTVDHTAIGLGYETGALLVTANYGMFDFGPGPDAEGYGLAVNYDLGGGAVVQVGYGSSDLANVDTFSVGLGLSF
ncbi:MAG: porin [Rhodobacterales bacterium]|nr:porin [Rhodobacterales bacterium]